MYTRRLYFIRHGATAGNLQGRYVGRTDEELLEESAVSLSKKDKLFGRVYTSPMKRCIQTAECLCASRNYTVIEQFTERDFGAYEYKNYKELSGDIRYQKWIDSNGTLPFPEGEDEELFYQRCIHGLQKMLLCEEQYGIAEAPVICILHGGVIMALLCRFNANVGGENSNGGMSGLKKYFYDYQCKNGEGYVITCKWSDACNPQFTDIKKYPIKDI